MRSLVVINAFQNPPATGSRETTPNGQPPLGTIHLTTPGMYLVTAHRLRLGVKTDWANIPRDDLFASQCSPVRNS